MKAAGRLKARVGRSGKAWPASQTSLHPLLCHALLLSSHSHTLRDLLSFYPHDLCKCMLSFCKIARSERHRSVSGISRAHEDNRARNSLQIVAQRLRFKVWTLSTVDWYLCSELSHAMQEKSQQHQKSTSKPATTMWMLSQCCTKCSVIGFILDNLLVVFVLILDLSGLALLGAGGRLLCSSLLALLRGLGSVAVFSVGRSTGSLGRHGNVVLSGEAGVTLGTGRRLATRRRDVRSSGKLTQRPWRATRARRRPSANPAESRLAHGLVGFGFW